MSSLASIIRSGLIWRAVPPTQTAPPPLKEQFSSYTNEECKELHELCVEQFPLNNPSQKKPLSFGIEEIDHALPMHGLAQGTIHEWSVFNQIHTRAFAPHSLFSWLAFRAWREIARNTQRFIFWIGKESWPSPHTLAQISLGEKEQADFFAQNIFLDVSGEKERLWSIETALRSSACALVIAPLSSTSLAVNRRFLLAAERGSSIGLFSTATRMQRVASGAHSRWEVTTLPSPTDYPSSDFPRWRLEIQKWKGAQPLETIWEVELAPPSIKALYFSNIMLPQQKGKQQQAYGKTTVPQFSEPAPLVSEAFSLHIPADVVDRALQKKDLQRKNAAEGSDRFGELLLISNG